MRGVLLVVADDLAAGVESLAVSNLIRLERLLAAHAGFNDYLAERDADA